MELQLNSELNFNSVTATLFIYSLFNLIVLKYLITYSIIILLMSMDLINLLSFKNKWLRILSSILYTNNLHWFLLKLV